MLYFIYITGIMASCVFAAGFPSTWPYFLITILISLVTGILLRIKIQKNLKMNAVGIGTYMVIFRNIFNEVVLLEEKKQNLSNQQIKNHIEVINCHIQNFLQYRENMANEFGLERFSEIYYLFSRGERYINRAWSAIVDGYRDEALDSISIAKESFIQIGT